MKIAKIVFQYYHMTNFSISDRWKALENDTAMAASFYQEMDDSFEAAVAYANVAVQMTPEELEDYGHHKDDMILSCHYKGMACSPA